VALACIPINNFWEYVSRIDLTRYIVTYAIFMVSMILYIVLHELAHGTLYKLMTGEKLTYGFSWSCAFCGVPNIYTYRRCALSALLAPLVIFTVIFVPILVFLSYANLLYYIGFSFIFAMHLGGCIGDGYLAFLLFTRYKDADVLMRDLGPEQFIYVRKKK
jgi:hypothetical protein